MATTPTESVSAQAPTRARYRVLGFGCSLAMLVYLDRACLGSAAGCFVRELGLTGVDDLKWAFSAFILAYALFEVPSGWMGDTFGPRMVLIRIVLWWSLFTALTGFVGMQWRGYTLGALYLPLVTITPLAMLAIVQFVQGAGEAGAFPSLSRMCYNWFPLQERGLVQGALWMSGRLMGGLTPLIWTVLVEGIHRPVVEAAQTVSDAPGWLLPPLLPWRAAFLLFGFLGVIWVSVFAMWFRNRPEESPKVNAAELAWIRGGRPAAQSSHAGVPWGRILRSRNLWTLCAMYFLQSFGWYFYLTYLPNFLEEQYGVARTSLWGALAKGGPLWMGAIGCLTGGFLTDWYIRRTGNRRVGRKLFGAIGHGSAAVCFLLCLLVPKRNDPVNAFTFFMVISLAGFCTDLAMGSAWSVCQDIGRRYSAIVAGFMNMIGNLGGALAPLVTGLVLQKSLAVHAAGLELAPDKLTAAQKAAGYLPGYEVCFVIFAAAYVVGVICWLNIDSTKAVAPEEA